MDTKNKYRKELIEKIEDIIFRSPQQPAILWCDEIKQYRNTLHQKSTEALESIYQRIQNCNWSTLQHQFMRAVVNEEPFLPLENPSK